MVDKELVEKWIAKADEDFGFARVSLSDEVEFFAQICFHFHQAAEKYLKSYIIQKDLGFKKIHDLILLLDICSSKDRSFENLRDDCVFLNRFYISTRYPVHWSSSFTKKDADGALKACEEISKKVKKVIFIS